MCNTSISIVKFSWSTLYSWYSGSADRLVPKLEARTISLIQSRVYLDYFIREQFTDDTGFTEMYIMDECALSYRVVFALQKYSIFRSKFGYLIMKMQVGNNLLILVGKYFFYLMRQMQTQINQAKRKLKDLPWVSWGASMREIDHNRYSWNRKKLKILSLSSRFSFL